MVRFLPLVLLIVLTSVRSSAQTSATVSIDAVVGECAAVVTVSQAPGAAPLVLFVDGVRVRERRVGNGRHMFPLNAAVESQHRLSAQFAGGAPVVAVLRTDERGTDQCGPAPAEEADDDREAFTASWYTGAVIDNFAPSRIANYVEDPTRPNQGRWVTGANFAFRIRGSRDVQLWLEGETLHGVRTSDVDCASPHPPEVCKQSPVSGAGANAQTVRYLLENATSLEAYIAPKLELLTLNRNTAAEAKFFTTLRLGVLALSDGPKMFPAHHVGVGLMSVNGPFDGSELQVGWGRSDIFERDPSRGEWQRFKLDAILSFDLAPGWRDGNVAQRLIGSLRPFVQFYMDNDWGGNAADSVQTFFGFDFDVRNAILP